jgi:hypothetical protein
MKMNEIEVELELFVVRNQEGKWFRRKGYGGYGDNWVDDIKKARIYANIKGARTVVGYYANNWPQFGIPDIIRLDIKSGEALNEAERIKKARQKKKENEEKKSLREKKRALKKAQDDFERAQSHYNKMKGSDES